MALGARDPPRLCGLSRASDGAARNCNSRSDKARNSFRTVAGERLTPSAADDLGREASTFPDESVRLGDRPALHDAIMGLLPRVDLRMSGDTRQRAEFGSRLRRDEGLQPSK